MDSKNYAIHALQNQLKRKSSNRANELLELGQNDDLAASIGLEDDSNLFLWNVVLEGAPDSLYEVSCEKTKTCLGRLL